MLSSAINHYVRTEREKDSSGTIMRTRYDDIPPYVTKDSSIIRELMHPVIHGNHNQSLAEAVVPVGSTTLFHRHV
jgi:uncharacterized protein YchJ